MSYELYFHPAALKEWKKLSPDIQVQFKKVLKRRLENPVVPSAKLSGALHECYKIKLRKLGYRLVYKVQEKQLIIVVVAIGQRNKNIVYQMANERKTDELTDIN